MRIVSALLLAALLGIASPSAQAATAVGFTDSSNLTVGQSASALFSVNQDWLHGLFTVNRTEGTFVFAVGGIYKFTVMGNSKTGFHVGPGVSIGTAPVSTVTVSTTGTTASATAGKSKFAFAIAGVAGGHFTLFERLILSVDGGPMLTVIDGDANFSLKPLGEVLGLSVHYLF